MNRRSTTRPLTPARHVAGGALLLAALLSVALVAYLPTRSAAAIELPFLEDHHPPVILAFAGYPGCGTVCPASLALMRDVYERVDAKSRVGLMFINIQRDTPAQTTAAYARAFHDDFLSYTVRSENAEPIYRVLSLRSFDDAGGAVQHSGYFYVFVRGASRWHIGKVYRSRPGQSRLLADLQRFAVAASAESTRT